MNSIMPQVARKAQPDLGGLATTVVLAITCFFMLTPVRDSSAMFRTFVLFAGLLLLPGDILCGWILPELRRSILGRIAFAFGLSLALATLVWLVVKQFGGSLQTFAVLQAGVLATLGVSVGVRAVARPNARPTAAPEPLAPLLLFGLCCLFWAIIIWRIGALYMPHADGWYYLAIVRRVLDVANLTPGDPYFNGIADPERSGPWLALVALIARQGGANLLALWNGLPAVIMPLALCAFYTLGRVLFDNPWPATLAVLLLFAGFVGFTWNEPMMMALPSNVALLLSWLTVGLWLTYARGASKRYLFVAVWLVLVVALQHALVYLGVLAIALSMAVATGAVSLLSVDTSSGDILSTTYWRRLAARTVIFIAACLVVGAPVLQLWTGSMRGTTNPIYSDLWGLFKTLGPWQVLRVSSLSGGPHLYAFSYLSLPLLLLFVRRHDWAVYLISTMTLAAMLAFLPPVVTVLLNQQLLPPWGLWRLVAQIYAFQFTVAILIYEGVRLMWPRLVAALGGRSRLALALLALVVAVSLLPNVTPLTASIFKYTTQAAQGRPLDRTADWLLSGPLAALPDDAPPLTLLSDANTSYYAGSLGPFRVVGIPYGHASPLVHDDAERLTAISLLNQPDGSLSDLYNLLLKYDIGAVLLVEDPGDGSIGLPTPAWERWTRLLDSAGSAYEPVYRDTTHRPRAALYLTHREGAAQ